METLFATRIQNTPRSLVREILRVTQDPSIISFAGGLPNAETLPVTEMAKAAETVLNQSGSSALQYSNSQGYESLREYIAQRYRHIQGLDVTADNILITHGSQQGLFLLGETFLNPGDSVVMEYPGYLGAIQALSMTESELVGVPVTQNGMDSQALQQALDLNPVRLVYTIPNYQNPSGVRYSLETRQDVAAQLASRYTVLVEDDPYGELGFRQKPLPSFWSLLPEQTVLLGSFSKIVAPGLRLGWVCAPQVICEQLQVAKQAADLHTSTLTQRILYEYLRTNDLDTHIQKLRSVYRHQCAALVSALRRYLGKSVSYQVPHGGMFLWLTLPEGVSAEVLFKIALKEKVAFVPGTSFYLDGSGDDCIRINFSNASIEEIDIGIRRLAKALRLML